MKQISFRVAKAIKEAGYPQELHDGTIFYAVNGLMDKYDSELYELFDPMYCVCPYAMEVWLWLWREKSIKIDLDYNAQMCFVYINNDTYMGVTLTDPEETIAAAIEYLVENDLIK